MPTNVKAPLRMQNRTKHFSPDFCRSHVRFGSSASYQSFKIKCEGYETRLYWQFRYCQENDGQTFYYTLTYNDASIPKYFGENCFDYEDLRYLLTGGFRKILLRQYGTIFKYFIGAELGDGKGQRGMHNNPHYHILFFLEPDPDSKFPYVKISPKEFRHLVRFYWQGFDEDVDGFRDYRLAKYGIAKEGLNCGLVTDARACTYCAKYVTKDSALVKRECDIEKRLRLQFSQEFKYSCEFHDYFLKEVLYPMYNTPLNPKKTEWSFDRLGLIREIYPSALDSLIYVSFRSGEKTINQALRTKEEFTEDEIFGMIHSSIFDFAKRNHLWKQYWECFDVFISDKVRVALNEYRNRYCNKCRISHGVGDYALKHIDDKMNPRIPFPDRKKGFKYRPPCLYYYRKLYTKVVIDDNGSPLRILTEEGMKYKVARLEQQINKLSEKAQINLDLVLSDSALFDKMRSSNVNCSVTMSHQVLKRVCARYNPYELTDIMKRYAIYKLVYEDRFFPFDQTGKGIDYFPSINVIFDYIRFLVPSVYSVARSDMRLTAFLESGAPNYLSYSEHPYFMQYIGIFAVLDLCTDYFFIQKDNKDEDEAKEIARIKRFHDKQKLKEFYSAFK